MTEQPTNPGAIGQRLLNFSRTRMRHYAPQPIQKKRSELPQSLRVASSASLVWRASDFDMLPPEAPLEDVGFDPEVSLENIEQEELSSDLLKILEMHSAQPPPAETADAIPDTSPTTVMPPQPTTTTQSPPVQRSAQRPRPGLVSEVTPERRGENVQPHSDVFQAIPSAEESVNLPDIAWEEDTLNVGGAPLMPELGHDDEAPSHASAQPESETRPLESTPSTPPVVQHRTSAVEETAPAAHQSPTETPQNETRMPPIIQSEATDAPPVNQTMPEISRAEADSTPLEDADSVMEVPTPSPTVPPEMTLPLLAEEAETEQIDFYDTEVADVIDPPTVQNVPLDVALLDRQNSNETQPGSVQRFDRPRTGREMTSGVDEVNSLSDDEPYPSFTEDRLNTDDLDIGVQERGWNSPLASEPTVASNIQRSAQPADSTPDVPKHTMPPEVEPNSEDFSEALPAGQFPAFNSPLPVFADDDDMALSDTLPININLTPEEMAAPGIEQDPESYSTEPGLWSEIDDHDSVQGDSNAATTSAESPEFWDTAITPESEMPIRGFRDPQATESGDLSEDDVPPDVDTQGTTPTAMEADLLRLLNLPPDTPVVRQQTAASGPDVSRSPDKNAETTGDNWQSTATERSPSHHVQPVPLDEALLTDTLSREDNSIQRRPLSIPPPPTVADRQEQEPQSEDEADESRVEESEKPNVDKLARDVFRLLRARLRIEQERRS